jgi:hypothetical protein
LLREERTKRRGRILAFLEYPSGKSKVAEHDGEAQTNGIAAYRVLLEFAGRRCHRVRIERRGLLQR